MNRRTLLSAIALAPLAACGNTINVPLPVQSIIDDVGDYLLQFAGPTLGGQLKALRDQLAKGGDWKATARAFVAVANSVLDLQVVPEPYASLARTALVGLGIFLGSASAASAGRYVSMEDAVKAAKALR